MSNREKLAGRMAHGLLAGGCCVDDAAHKAEDLAVAAVRIADAVLAELEKPQALTTLKQLKDDQASCSVIPNDSRGFVQRVQYEAIQDAVDRSRNYLNQYAWPQGGIPDNTKHALEEVEGHAERLREEAKGYAATKEEK